MKKTEIGRKKIKLFTFLILMDLNNHWFQRQPYIKFPFIVSICLVLEIWKLEISWEIFFTILLASKQNGLVKVKLLIRYFVPSPS